MSNNNSSDNTVLFLVVGVIMAMAYFLLIAAIAFAVIATIVYTILAVMAWDRPLRFAGTVITPADAQGFIKRGVVGAFALPLLLFVGDLFFDWNINWHYRSLFMIAGYCAGSLGLEMLFADDQRSGPLFEYLPREPEHRALPPTTTKSLPAPPREPFRFASWDDEER